MVEMNTCLSCDGAVTSNWYAWNDLMPPGPPDFHVIGDVKVANPGVDPVLHARVPQGINPKILLLNLFLVQRPGIWPQIEVVKQVRYDRTNITYEQVQVFCGEKVIADIKVEDVH